MCREKCILVKGCRLAKETAKNLTKDSKKERELLLKEEHIGQLKGEAEGLRGKLCKAEEHLQMQTCRYKQELELNKSIRDEEMKYHLESENALKMDIKAMSQAASKAANDHEKEAESLRASVNYYKITVSWQSDQAMQEACRTEERVNKLQAEQRTLETQKLEMAESMDMLREEFKVLQEEFKLKEQECVSHEKAGNYFKSWAKEFAASARRQEDRLQEKLAVYEEWDRRREKDFSKLEVQVERLEHALAKARLDRDLFSDQAKQQKQQDNFKLISTQQVVKDVRADYLTVLQDLRKKEQENAALQKVLKRESCRQKEQQDSKTPAKTLTARKRVPKADPVVPIKEDAKEHTELDTAAPVSAHEDHLPRSVSVAKQDDQNQAAALQHSRLELGTQAEPVVPVKEDAKEHTELDTAAPVSAHEDHLPRSVSAAKQGDQNQAAALQHSRLELGTQAEPVVPVKEDAKEHTELDTAAPVSAHEDHLPRSVSAAKQGDQNQAAALQYSRLELETQKQDAPAGKRPAFDRAVPDFILPTDKAAFQACELLADISVEDYLSEKEAEMCRAAETGCTAS